MPKKPNAQRSPSDVGFRGVGVVGIQTGDAAIWFLDVRSQCMPSAQDACLQGTL